jgi:hypothetical protein
MSFANNVKGTLNASVSIGATTVQVIKAVSPYNDPPSSGKLTFMDSLSSPTKIEIIEYTGATDNTTYWTLTGVTKGMESSGDQSWSAGDAYIQALTAADVSNGSLKFTAKNAEGSTITKGQVVYISGISGTVPTVALADADDSNKMPAYGYVEADANDNASVEIVTFGTLTDVAVPTATYTTGDTLYVSATPGAFTKTAPTGETSQLQNIGMVQRAHDSAGSIKVGGAGRTNATPNLNDGNIFIGNASNQAESVVLSSVAIAELSADTTPQLGGDLDLNGNAITGMVLGTDVQAYDADLASLSSCQAGGASALAALTSTEIGILDGATVTTAELNILDGATVTTAELNILDGVTSTTAELNILDGVTSTAAELNILDGVTSTAAELNILDGATSTAAELNILDGAAANTVVNSKAVVYGSAGEVQATTVDLGNWTVTESSGVLYFATGGVNKMKLDASGNLTVVGNVISNGTI